jgi:anti-anti-sigma factor
LRTSTHHLGRHEPAVVVALAGDIDLLTASAAHTVIHQALTAGHAPITELVIDLAQVTLLSAKAIHLLVDAQHEAKQCDIEMRVITGAGHPIVPALRTAAHGAGLNLYRTRQEAIKMVSSTGQTTDQFPRS